MKKLLTILLVLSSVFAIGQTTHTSAYDQYPSQQNPSLGTRFFVHGYLRGDTLIIVDKDTTGWQPSRDGVITYHNNALFRWDSTFAIWLQIAGGGGGDSTHQSLNFDALFLSNSPYYNTDFPVSLSLDTINYIATKSDITNGFPDTTTDTTNGAYKWNAELIIYGDFTPVDGHQYLIWNTVTGTDYVGHEKQIMKVIGGVPNYYDAALGDLILIGDDTTATTTYTLIPSPGWVKGKVFVNTGINYTPTTLDISTNGSHQLRFGTNGKIRGFFAANGNFYLNSFKGADSATQYLRANPDGKISLGDFIPAIIYVDSVSVQGDSLIVFKDGRRNAYLVGGSGASETWEQTLTNQGSTPFTTDNTVDFGEHSLEWDNLSGLTITNLGSGYFNSTDGINNSSFYLQPNDAELDVSNDSIALGVGAVISTGIDDSYAILTASNSGSDNPSNQSIKAYSSKILIDGNTNSIPNTKLQINDLDSSNADANNIAWFDSDNILHRGHVAGGSGDSTFKALNWQSSDFWNVKASNDSFTNSTNFRAAMNYLISKNGGTFYFQYADSAYKGNFRIPFVALGYNIAIRILGATPPAFEWGTIDAAPLPTAGVILISTDTITGGAVFKQEGSTFCSVQVFLENIDFRTYDKPLINGVDLGNSPTVTLKNVFINTARYNVQAGDPSTTRQTTGLILPLNGNGVDVILDHVDVTGYFNGINVTEHTVGHSINIGSCWNALNIQAGYHSAYFDRVCLQRNRYNIKGASGSPNPNLYISNIDIEHVGAGQYADSTAWQQTVYDVNDSLNLIHGFASYTTVLGGTGTTQTFTKNGANLFYTYASDSLDFFVLNKANTVSGSNYFTGTNRFTTSTYANNFHANAIGIGDSSFSAPFSIKFSGTTFPVIQQTNSSNQSGLSIKNSSGFGGRILAWQAGTFGAGVYLHNAFGIYSDSTLVLATNGNGTSGGSSPILFGIGGNILDTVASINKDGLRVNGLTNVYGNLRSTLNTYLATSSGGVAIGSGSTPSGKLDITGGDINLTGGSINLLTSGNGITIKGAGTNRDIQFAATSSNDNLAQLGVYPPTGTNVGSQILVIPKGTGFSSTLKSSIIVMNTDYVANPNNWEGLGIQAEGSAFSIISKTYNGSLRPIYIAADGSANQLLLNTNGTIQMAHYGAGTATFDASGNISSSSDIRLKTNIHPFNSGLKELMKINPITYKWKKLSGNETDSTYAGFSAQNIKANIPYGTGVNKDGYLSLQDRAIMATLVNAVKEQQAEIELMKKEILNLTVLNEKIKKGIIEGTKAAIKSQNKHQ